MLKIRFSVSFARRLKKLPKEVQIKFRALRSLLEADPFDTRLRTHKLQGIHEECYAISVTYSIRAIFMFVSKDEVAFVSIGDHDIYKYD